MNLKDLKSLLSEEEKELINKLNKEYKSNILLRGKNGTTINDLMPTLNEMNFQYSNYKLTFDSNNSNSILLKLKADSLEIFLCLKNKLNTYYIDLYLNINDVHEEIYLYYNRKEMLDLSSKSFIKYSFKNNTYYHEQMYSDALFQPKKRSNQDLAEFFNYIVNSSDKKRSDLIDFFNLTHDFNLENDLLFNDVYLFFSAIDQKIKKLNKPKITV